jgi:hypothetical protein
LGGRSVKIISAVGKDDLKEIFSLSYKRNPTFTAQLLNSTEYNVNPSECLDQAKIDDSAVFVICLGILNVLARSMVVDNSVDAHSLDLQEFGTVKYCSYAFSPEFPYPHLFSRKISQLLASGIPNHSVRMAIEESKSESRRNSRPNITATKNNTKNGTNSTLDNKLLDYNGKIIGKKDPISVQLIDIVMNIVTIDFGILSIVLIIEIVVGYRGKITSFIRRIWLRIINWGRLLSRKLNNFIM